MASTVTGYEYDIFISYRHNDNRSGWVSEFVRHLNEELASTIKEPVSVYFDSNPHNGLRETHDVDESLKEKLKCFIFIPVISQTYCDPKSFAWNNELLPFKKSASEDHPGLKIKLQNGNVASRILPVRIHDLDENDKATLEQEIGQLRAIDFIFKAPGVNRPLTPSDLRNENFAKTVYKDQVNKVANAIKELVSSLHRSPEQSNALGEIKEIEKSKENRKVIFGIAAIVVLVAAFILLKMGYPSKNAVSSNLKKRIAIMPFKLIGDKEGEYFAAGMKEALINSLEALPQTELPPSLTKTEKYQVTTLTPLTIAKELRADYIIECTTQKWGDSIQMFIQLLDPFADEIIWKANYRQPFAKIFELQANLAKEIGRSLKLTLTPAVKQRIELRATDDPEAYDLFLQGTQWHTQWVKSAFGSMEFWMKATSCYKKSIAKDRKFADPYYALGICLAFKSYDSTMLLINKAIELRPTFSKALHMKSELLFFAKDTINSLKLVDQSIAADSSDLDPIMWRGHLYSYWLNDNREIMGLQQYINAYNKDPNFAGSSYALWNIGIVFQNLGDHRRSEFFVKKALALTPGDYRFLNSLGSIYEESGQFNKLYALSDTMKMFHDRSTNYDHLYWRAMANLYNGRSKEALKEMKEFLKHYIPPNGIGGLGSRDRTLDYAVILKKNGYEEKARSICEEVIKNVQQKGSEVAPANFDAPSGVKLCRAYALTGHKEKALSSLEKARFHPIYFGLHEFLEVDLAVESLRNEPRFRAIILREKNKWKAIRDRAEQMEKEKLLVVPAMM